MRIISNRCPLPHPIGSMEDIYLPTMDSEMNLICSAVSIPSGLPRCDMICAGYKKGTGPYHFTLCPFYLVTVHSHQYGSPKQIRPRTTTNSD